MCKVKNRPRLYYPASLELGGVVRLSVSQGHYIMHVMRLGVASELLLFNERQGEFIALIELAKKQKIEARITSFVRPPQPLPSLVYYFAPIKQLRLDYMVQKAVEMGAGVICPIKTSYTQMANLNYERLAANAVEAVEQCGAVYLPEIRHICSFAELIKNWDVSYNLIFCDEKATEANSLEILRKRRKEHKNFAALIGPEGGFSADERAALYDSNFATPISLGAHILRADTAAVAAMALIGAVCREK